MSYLKSSKEYSAIYKCDTRTIRRWKAKAYPLDDPDAMVEILASQKNRPQGDVAQEDDLPPGEISMQEAKRRKTVAEWKRTEFKLEVEKGLYTANAEIAELGYKLGAELGSAINQLVGDLPALIVGKDEAGVSEVVKREAFKMRKMVADGLSAWCEQYAINQILCGGDQAEGTETSG